MLYSLTHSLNYSLTHFMNFITHSLQLINYSLTSLNYPLTHSPLNNVTKLITGAGVSPMLFMAATVMV